MRLLSNAVHTGSGLALALALAACGSSTQTQPTPQPTANNAGGEQLGTTQPLSNTPSAAPEPPAPPPPPPVRVVVGESTPIPAGANPRVAFASPRDGSTVRTNRVELRLRVTDWPAPQEMRHVHLILDNEPYRRIDDPSRPVVLENLAQGTHVVRAFPGWGSHESVKRDGAFAMMVFHVGRADPAAAIDRRAPMLTYSRPKGDYNGAEANRILLDFYVSNVPGNALSATGHRVRYSIDGSTTGEATSWVPHFIENLPDGAHTITLDLLGPDGQPVAGRFNHTERTINVSHAPPAEVSMPAGAGAHGNPCAMGHEGHGMAAPSAAPSAGASANPCAAHMAH